jgi:hypothetical protein
VKQALRTGALWLATVFFSLPTWGFTLVSNFEGQEGFAALPVSVHVNPANCPTGVGDALAAAMDLWHSAPTSKLRLAMGAQTSTSIATLLSGNFSEQVVVACSTNIASDTSGTYAASTVAGVGVALLNSAGQIRRGYLLINVDNSPGSQRFDLLSTAQQNTLLAHEMGHVLGLGHSPYEGALMYFDGSLKTSLNLHQDDIDGISYLYPLDSAAGCGRIAIDTTPAPNLRDFLLNLSLLLLLMLPVLWRAFARRSESSPVR